MSKIIHISASTSSPPEEQSKTPFWEFKNSADNDEATLYVYGDIVTYDLDGWNYPDDVVPNKFKNDLNALGDVKTIHVRINSNGGSVFAAYAIMNLLKNHKAKVITYNDGIAASAATIIAMAGEKIVTALGSIWMIHLPSLRMWGSYNSNDLIKMSETLDTITQSMTDIYHAKTGIEKAELESMLKEETWLTGTQAVEKGFADEMTEMEVVAYLNEDKKTAFFNSLQVDMSQVKNKTALEKLLPSDSGKQSGVSVNSKLQGDLLKESIASFFQEYAKNNPQVPTQTVPDNHAEVKTLNNNETEESIMDLNELKAKHPDIYNAAKQEGVQEGVTAERGRIKGIEDISLPGMEAIAAQAKFDSGITASEFAIAMIKAQKEKGLEYFKDAQADAKGLNEVPSNPAPQPDAQADAAKKDELLNVAAETGKSLRG